MGGPVLFACTDANPERVRAWAEARYPAWSWLFLAADFTKLQKWRAGLGSAFGQMPVHVELESAARRLKQPYLRWLAELGHRHPEPAWWASRISERNTALSPLFEDVCRLEAVRNLIRDVNGPVLVVAENPALLDTLDRADWLRSRPRFRPLLAKVPAWLPVDLARVAFRHIRYARAVNFGLRVAQLCKMAFSARLGGMAQLPVSCAKPILMHTYLDESAFRPDGEFHDRYFPGLAELLQKEGYQVLVLPVMFNVRRSLRQAWAWTKSSSSRFVNPYALYRLADYVFALRIASRAAHLPEGPLKFEGNDLSAMVRGENERTAYSVLTSILNLRLPLRLREQGIACSALLAEFENMIPEKMLIQGFREHSPDTELIGFQHGALYPHLLCNFTPPEERDIAPMYDRVVCNGRFFRDILVAEGLAPERAVVGAALRYRHLWEHEATISRGRPMHAVDVFVPLPLMLPAGVELLEKLLGAFAKSTSLRILLKAHPLSSVDALLKAADVATLPAHFRTTDDPTGVILPRARLVVGLSTSTMLEALASGVPVIRVGQEGALMLDTLGFFDDLPPPVYSGLELAREADRLLALSAGELEKISQRGREIVAMSFRPCDELGLRTFLPAIGRAATGEVPRKATGN
jgi:hypothetical protein